MTDGLGVVTDNGAKDLTTESLRVFHEELDPLLIVLQMGNALKIGLIATGIQVAKKNTINFMLECEDVQQDTC